MALNEATSKLFIIMMILIKLTSGEQNFNKPTQSHRLTKRHHGTGQQLQFEPPEPSSYRRLAPPGALETVNAFDDQPGALSSLIDVHSQLPEASALVQQQVSGSSGSSSSNGKAPLIRTVNPGDRINIPCSLANMGGSIQFAKDDQPIILDSGCAHCQLDISNDGQASLTINRVSQRDQGHWQCWRLDAQGKVKQKIPIIQLAVTNSPELPILIVNDKELLGGNNLDATITIKENELVSFKCVIKGASTPVDYVHWILDSNTNVTQMSQLMMEYSAQENNYLTQSVLKLNATKAMNMKSITCLSNHQLWLTPMTVTALLNVLYEPSFTISREPGFGVPVSEGMTVILKCEIDSNPSSSPIWIKDADNKTSQTGSNQDNNQAQQQINGKESSGEPIVLDTQEDGSVVFQPARQSDSGWYRCKTENKYGNFSSFGYYLNVRPAGSNGGTNGLSPQSVANNNGGHNQQPHIATNYQRPRSDSRIMGPNQAAQVATPPNYLAHSPVSSSSVPVTPAASFQTVRPMLQQDGPLQRSQLANDQPHVSGHSQLVGGHQSTTDETRCRTNSSPRLDGFPEIKSPILTMQAVLGRQLILPLRFCCQPGPARVFWIHRHLAMIPGRMFGPYITREVYPTYNSPYCYETTFEIEQVKPEDIGTVYVFVSNEKGHAGAQIHIQLAKQLAGGASQSGDLHHSQQQFNNFNSQTAGNLGSRFSFGATSSSSSSSSASSTNTTTTNSIQFVLLALILVATTIIQFNATFTNHYQVFASHLPKSRRQEIREKLALSNRNKQNDDRHDQNDSTQLSRNEGHNLNEQQRTQTTRHNHQPEHRTTMVS